MPDQNIVNMKMRILMGILILITQCWAIQTYERKMTRQAHGTSLVTTASFFNDQVRMITGGKDFNVHIWSLANFTILHTITEADTIQNVALHPIDNRIFVLVGNGAIKVYDPVNYASLNSVNHPSAGSSGYGNYLVFDMTGGKYIIGGFDGVGLAPKMYFYDITSYAYLSAVSTGYGPAGYVVGDEINTMSMNPSGNQIALTNIGTNYKLLIYDLTTSGWINSFDYTTNQIKWAIFDVATNYLCSTSTDQNIKCYSYNTGSRAYSLDKSWSTAAFGYPYCMGFGIANTLIASGGRSLLFYDLTLLSPTFYLNYTDTANIFVFDSTIDLSYIVTGMASGYVSVWKKVIQQSQTHEQMSTILGHGYSLVTTASFFNDKQRMITGGFDNTARVWSVFNLSVLHTFPMADTVMNVALHPIDNRIFIVLYNGNILIYDSNYAYITTVTHPSGNANYLVFDPTGSKFIIGGYDGAGAIPRLHIYDSTSYTSAGASVTTAYLADQQINTISLSADGGHLVLTNLEGAATSSGFKVLAYRLSDWNIVANINYNAVQVKWAIFDISGYFFCVTSADQNIKCYKYSTISTTYNLDKSWNTVSMGGYPYCMSFSMPGTIIVSVSRSIVYYNLTQATPTPYLNFTDVDDIFVLDNTPDMSYIVTGMRHGQVGLWKHRPPTPNNLIQEQQVEQKPNLGLIIGLSVGIPVFVFLVILIICCYCRKAAFRIKTDDNEEEPSKISMREEIEEKNANIINDRFVVLKDDSDNSTDLDYDELHMQGTIIVIKDEQEKKKYLKKMQQTMKKHNRNDNDYKNFKVKGSIIIIRDEEHSLKQIKQKQNDKSSESSQDFDYDMLMAEGCIIVIKDQDLKQKFVKQLKQYPNKDKDDRLSQILVKGNTVVLKSEYDQKKLLKQLRKENQISKINHDKALGNGDILIIQDKNKKKQFIDSMKKELKKNNQNDGVLKGLEVAEQIIVIRGDDDIDDDMSYEQLMAQGTVIVIKDDQIKKQYAQHLQAAKQKNKAEQGKKRKGSDKSSQPDYDMLMAQQCIIVIKDDNDKRQYVNFIKNRKVMSDKSSEMCYQDLLNGNVINLNEQMKTNVVRVKKNNAIAESNQQKMLNRPDYHELMAQKNVVIINEEGENSAEDPKRKIVEK